MLHIPDVIRRKAALVGAPTWIDSLPNLVDSLADSWGFRVESTFDDSTEALVLAVQMSDDTPATVKIGIPRPDGDQPARESAAIRAADGHGCVRLLAESPDHHAMLLERLGAPLSDLGMTTDRRQQILADAAKEFWRPALSRGFMTGAQKGRWLIESIRSEWQRSGEPCAAATVAHAVDCAERRIAAHDPATAVLVHGDVHQWNTLERARTDGSTEFVLIDPDGLVAEPAYDLGVIMREDPSELLEGEPRERSHRLAEQTGVPEQAIWEWGVVERVATGLVCLAVGIEEGSLMLTAADRIAASD